MMNWIPVLSLLFVVAFVPSARAKRQIDLVLALDTIDESYGRLLEFSAGGGSDRPESVHQARADAVNRVGWETCPNVDCAIILAGDAPPHMDYHDEVQWPTTVRNARTRGIAIHTIACGGNPQTQSVWQAIARAGVASSICVWIARGLAKALPTPRISIGGPLTSASGGLKCSRRSKSSAMAR